MLIVLINIDFTDFLKLNTICEFKNQLNINIRIKYYVRKFKEIYDQSIKNPEKFWQEASMISFGLKNQLKF